MHAAMCREVCMGACTPPSGSFLYTLLFLLLFFLLGFLLHLVARALAEDWLGHLFSMLTSFRAASPRTTPTAGGRALSDPWKLAELN